MLRPYLRTLLPLALAGLALADGPTVSQLGGQTLCLDASSVQVGLENVGAPQHRNARPQLERALRGALLNGLTASGVRHEVRDSCRGSAAFVRLSVSVRYLDPQHYLGYGNSAYSYGVGLWVGTWLPPNQLQTSPDRFNTFWSDIYAESRAGGPFEPVVVGRGEEQVRALAVAWHTDNPPLLARLKAAPPLWLGTVGALGGALLALGGLAALRAWRGRRQSRST